MTSRQRVPGVRLLWPMAALLSLAGVVLLALGAVGTAGRASSDLVGVVRGQEVSVPEEGMSVWSRSPQTRAEAVCTVDDTVLLRPVEDFTVRVSGEDFHEVARTGPELSGSTGPLVCDTEDAVYAGPYAPATAPTGLRGGTGLTLGLLLLPLGLVCAALALLARRPPAPAEAGPDPSTYTLDPRSAPRPTPAKDAPSGPRYDLPPPS